MTRVSDKHYSAVKPLALKGKACYVEWPLAKNAGEARELLDLVRQNGNGKTIVGLQGRTAPVVQKVRQLVSDGSIGRVLSSNITASAGNMGQVDGESTGRLINHKTVGATMLSIHFGHMVDYVL